MDEDLNSFIRNDRKWKIQYILNAAGEPIAVENYDEWLAWTMTPTAIELGRIKRETVLPGINVSTVFLIMDHNFRDEGGPILWETMVFGGDCDGEQDRCSGGREQAEAMHVAMVERVMAVEALKSPSADK